MSAPETRESRTVYAAPARNWGPSTCAVYHNGETVVLCENGGPPPYPAPSYVVFGQSDLMRVTGVTGDEFIVRNLDNQPGDYRRVANRLQRLQFRPGMPLSLSSQPSTPMTWDQLFEANRRIKYVSELRRQCQVVMEQLQRIGRPILVGSTSKDLEIAGREPPDFDILLIFQEGVYPVPARPIVGAKIQLAAPQMSTLFQRVQDCLGDGSVVDLPAVVRKYQIGLNVRSITPSRFSPHSVGSAR